ncbi:hypothetical protein V1264_002733 [Littorina saxatilis]|uniref:Ig-like domain-containing protein n=1 Tax=Littorina saxatilis TaxID=31220 RepID=A0AAN9B3H7_9CAEN
MHEKVTTPTGANRRRAGLVEITHEPQFQPVRLRGWFPLGCPGRCSDIATLLLCYLLLLSSHNLCSGIDIIASADLNVTANVKEFDGSDVVYTCETTRSLNITRTPFPLSMRLTRNGVPLSLASRWRFEGRVTDPYSDKYRFKLRYRLTVTGEDDGMSIECSTHDGQASVNHTVDVKLFDKPVFLGPLAVEAVSTVNFTCSVARVEWDGSSNFFIHWIINDKAQRDNAAKTQVRNDEDFDGSVKSVTSVLEKYIPDDSSSMTVMCVAQHVVFDSVKNTGKITVLVFILDRPVLSGPTEVRVGLEHTWTCVVGRASSCNRENITLMWFVGNFQAENQATMDFQDTQIHSRFPAPLCSITSTLNTSITGTVGSSLEVRCRVVVHDVHKDGSLNVTLLPGEGEENVGGTQGEQNTKVPPGNGSEGEKSPSTTLILGISLAVLFSLVVICAGILCLTKRATTPQTPVIHSAGTGGSGYSIPGGQAGMLNESPAQPPSEGVPNDYSVGWNRTDIRTSAGGFNPTDSLFRYPYASIGSGTPNYFHASSQDGTIPNYSSSQVDSASDLDYSEMYSDVSSGAGTASSVD